MLKRETLLLCLTLSLWNILLFHGNTVSASAPFDIDYLRSSNTSSLHSECSLSFDLSMIGISNWNLMKSSTNDTINELILYWIHSHIFTLIDSSFLYNIDAYTDDFWNDFYLHLTAISNETLNTITLSIDICVTELQLQQIIESVLINDGDEIAAFIRYKLTHELGVNDLNVGIMLIHAISSTNTELFAIETTLWQSTTLDAVDTTQRIQSIDNDAFVFTKDMLYIGMIAFCVIIITLIATLFSMLCIKQKTEKRLDLAIKQIKTHTNQRNGEHKGKGLGDNDIISIEPIPIPTHLASIDTGLNRENVLTDIDDDSSDSSMNIQRNKLALSGDKQILEQHDASEIEALNATLNIDDINHIIFHNSSSPSSLPNTVFIEDTDYRAQCLQSMSMSARLSHLHRHNDDIYSGLPAIDIPIPYSRSMDKNTSKHIRRYRRKHQSQFTSRHSIVGKQYAKRVDIEGKHRQMNKRSQSKPNLRLKRPKLHNSYSHQDVFPQNGYKQNNSVFSINHSNSIRSPHNDVPILPNKNSLSIKSGSSMMLYHHKESVDVDAIEFDGNGNVKIDLTHLKALDPPIPNPEDIKDNMNEWESESESSIHVCKTNTTKGTPSGIEGVGAHSINNSDAHSHNVSVVINTDLQSVSSIKSEVIRNEHADNNNNNNVYKVLKVNNERVTLTQKVPHDSNSIVIPPPPPAPPQQEVQDRRHQTVHIRLGVHDTSGYDNNGHGDKDNAKFDALSVIAVQSSVSRYQPNF